MSVLDALTFLGTFSVVKTVKGADQIPCDSTNAFKFHTLTNNAISIHM